MSGRHRKPTHTGLRLVRVGALTVMAMAPLTSMTGMAFADTPDSDHDESSSVDPDSSGWSDDGDRHHHGDEDTADRSDLKSFDWRDSHSPHSTHRHSTGSSDDSDHSRGSQGSSKGSTGSALGSATPAAALAKWDKLAQCESTQNWSANSGNGYQGGLQFSDATWRAYGGGQYARSAHQASRLEQIAVARKVQQAQGWKAWPGCSRKLGYS
jgi:hypothetical protein